MGPVLPGSAFWGQVAPPPRHLTPDVTGKTACHLEYTSLSSGHEAAPWYWSLLAMGPGRARRDDAVVTADGDAPGICPLMMHAD